MSERRRGPSMAAIAAFAFLCIALAAGYWIWSARGVEGTAELARSLEDLGRVAVVGQSDLMRLHAPGAQLVDASDVEGLVAALEGEDEAALVEALEAADVNALIVDGRRAPPRQEATTLAQRLASYGSFERLEARYLAPRAALYAPRSGLLVEAPVDFAIGYVARGILGGARPPRVSSFPEPLRRIRSVEVMVMLRDGGRPRLWRSARGSSIARALLTASTVARQRWAERETAMGGSLDRQLRVLDVEVYLLEEDGTLGNTSAAFIDRAFAPEHGVAYDHLGTWRYLLPDATAERGGGSAVRAYHALFEESDMEPESFDRPDVRLYRMLARQLASSRAPGLR